MTEQATRPADDWWRSAVVYQVYRARSPTPTVTAPAT
ncbi:hypothetical protein HNR71_002464 [Kribbella sandramycini]|uniref:Uncharacterized protein n=1 Tax=Kribbella sandramycini TaxID=60450 RepID=A0A841S7Y0_9ACTN|nr:hypothetical protein [Kribbella sandramycini]